jgi:ABC-type polar amino acid transport system ATPase subunit
VKLRRLELHRFTAFEAAQFEFTSGVNVLIGENGTGKSHVLKLIYVLSESVRRFSSGEGLDGSRRKQSLSIEEILTEMFQAVFQPDELHRLVRRGVGRRKARITATWSREKKERRIEVTLTSLGRLSVTGDDLPDLEPSVFIPTREVLSIYPGFISSYLKRESAFDRTFYDLCVALDAKPLRGPRDDKRRALLEPLEQVLGGRVVNENGRFYLKLPDGDMEAPLVAEGIRKLGMIAYLIINGSLAENGFLLWDEPEASMNPKLTRLVGQVAQGLARSGVQTWIATHDYLLTSELTLIAETSMSSDTVFFALTRRSGAEGTSIESGSRLGDLKHNSILKAMAELHQREEEAFHASGQERPR